MTAPDARALARQLGPDAMEALFEAAYGIAEYGPDGLITAHQLIPAARRLAAPVEPEPIWPTETWWAWFNLFTGELMAVDDEDPDADNAASIVLPCRVVSADAVVLTAGQAADCWQKMNRMTLQADVDHENRRAILGALRREPTP